MNRLLPISLLACGVLAFSACDSSTSSDSTPPPTPPGMTAADVAMLDALFAPATAAETTLIASQWAERAPQVSDVRTEASFRMSVAAPAYVTLLGFPKSWTDADTLPMRVVSHVVDGFRHNGILHVPGGAGPFPVVVFAHGGDDGVDEQQWNTFIQSLGTLRDSIALIAPSFRSEPVDIEEGVWTSQGSPSPWDRDVDDLRGLLRACAKIDPKLDTSRVSVVGYSRGGGVALLSAERDPAFKSVFTIAAPTSFQGPWVRGLAESILKGEAVDLPGVDYIESAVLKSLKSGSIGMDSARRELVRRSASTWARRLPAALQSHHGMADVTVPSSELDRLVDALHVAGRSVDSHFWPNRDHYSVLVDAFGYLPGFVRTNLFR